MSEGSSRLLPASVKRKKLERRYTKVMMNRKVKSQSEIVQGALKALDEHKKIVRTLKLHVKNMENQMVVEGNSMFLRQIPRAIRRDFKLLKNLKKMKKKIAELTAGEDRKNEGEEGGVKHEGEGESNDDASRHCAALEEEEARGVDGRDDEHDECLTDSEEEALRMREYIEEDDYTYCPSGEDKVNYRKWARCYKQIRESKLPTFPVLLSGLLARRELGRTKNWYFSVVLSSMVSEENQLTAFWSSSLQSVEVPFWSMKYAHDWLCNSSICKGFLVETSDLYTYICRLVNASRRCFKHRFLFSQIYCQYTFCFKNLENFWLP